MNWASNETEEKPLFNQVYVEKETIADYDAFVSLISLYDLYVIAEEELYYIIDGSDENLEEFKYNWNFYLDKSS